MAVASAQHARRGCATPGAGFMQVCHGNAAPLLDALEFVMEDRPRWGAKFRFGLFAVSDHDMRVIAQAMRADWRALGWA